MNPIELAQANRELRRQEYSRIERMLVQELNAAAENGDAQLFEVIQRALDGDEGVNRLLYRVLQAANEATQ